MRVTWVAVTAGLLGAAVGAMRAASRLDRLHVRTDAAWAALDAALYRRAVVASALDGPSALRRTAHAALLAGPMAREDVENELGRMLSVLDRCRLEPARANRLAEAEQTVVIARRVYNDAVRDTLALRSRRMVRWLRLAGTAPLPTYFEIVEPELPAYGLELDGAGA
ncbi:MAG: NUDIX hydrolase [Pseudonocardiales bacterium]|nr:NUDIX hydrolase [Pseudonocardiales bacterium]MBV9650267.1 NUDIX hydrolase [Pseudonocardiales bacterium]